MLRPDTGEIVLPQGGTAPTEQPPRKLSGKKTVSEFWTLKSGAACSRRWCKSLLNP